MTDEKRFQIFVSSTSDDLRDERQKIWETLVSLDYIVSGMEAFPATNDTQFEFIKKQIEQSDYYILIIAGRYGTITDNGTSFTEREFDFAQTINVPTLVFPIKDPSKIPVGKTDSDSDRRQKLETFRAKATKNRLCSLWHSADELALMVVKSLQAAVKSNPRPGWTRGGEASTGELLSELRKLRNENDQLKSTSHQNMSEKAPPDLQQELRKAYAFGYYSKTDPKKHATLQLSLKSILLEMSLFEPPDFELFEECVRGAIAARGDKEFNDIGVDRAETDRAILFFANAGVIQLDKDSTGSLTIKQGKYWIAAHSEAKLVR